MDSGMIRSLERAGAIQRREGGLWGITKEGREMSVLLAGLAREPGDKDDGINFDYGAWQEADKAFDHAAYDAKCKEVEAEAFGEDELTAHLEKWMAAHERVMKGVESPPFKPNASYNKHGDGLQVCICTDDSYTQWLCPGVEVTRAFSDRRIVGFNVWGLSHVVARDGGELRRLPDEDERFLAVRAMRPPGMDDPLGDDPLGDGPIAPDKPVS